MCGIIDETYAFPFVQRTVIIMDLLLVPDYGYSMNSTDTAKGDRIYYSTTLMKNV